MAPVKMSPDREIKELEQRWCQSRRAIPVYAAMFAVIAILFWLFGQFSTVPAWLTIVLAIALLEMTAFTLIGDAVNCIYCSRKLKALRSR